MQQLKNHVRFEVLAVQFRMAPKSMSDPELERSLQRIFSYIYSSTNVFYLEFVDESVLYGYIKHHREKGFQEVSFADAVRDVKNFLFFLKYIKGVKNPPSVDLGVKNIRFWANL